MFSFLKRIKDLKAFGGVNRELSYGFKLFLLENGTFRITTYTPGVEKDILLLFKKVFGWSKSYLYWNWEFRQNPYGTFLTLGWHKERLISQCASIPVKIWVNGRTSIGAQLVDCMSDPEYRGVAVRKKGIFVLTVQFFYRLFTGKDKISFLYGFPNWRHFKLGSIYLGYKKLAPIREVEITPSDMIKRKKRKTFKIINPCEVDFLKGYFEFFHKKDLMKFKFSLFKEWRYLKWRYFSHPVYRYCAVVLCNKLGVPQAIGIVREEKECVYLMDIFNLEKIKDILFGIPLMFGKPLKAWFPRESEICKSLIDEGIHVSEPFIKAVPGYVAFTDLLSNDKWVAKNFFYTMGDSDLF